MGWTANVIALSIFLLGTAALSLALLWRVTTWTTHAADRLTNFEGLPIGSPAKPLAAHDGRDDAELMFEGKRTFLMFASSGCKPCAELLRAASNHPATRDLRKVVVSDDENHEAFELPGCRWESYRFHDEELARSAWKAPVSPYFYVIDEFSRVMAKGVANRPEHLDRLLDLPPSSLRVSTLEPITTGSYSDAG